MTVQSIVPLTCQGLSSDQIVEEYDRALTQAEVHEALGYFYDHVGEIEQYLIENRNPTTHMAETLFIVLYCDADVTPKLAR